MIIINIVYYAENGEAFNDRESCEKYEELLKSPAMPEMYDSVGRKTAVIEHAGVVIMKSKTNYETYFKLCDQNGLSHEGMDMDLFYRDPVCYIWHSYEQRFVKYTRSFFNAADIARRVISKYEEKGDDWF